MQTFRIDSSVVENTTESFIQTVDTGRVMQKELSHGQILWIQESETRFYLMLRGRVVKDGPIHSDVGGYLDSCKFKQPGSPRVLAGMFGISPDSTLELVVRATVFLMPVIETPMSIEHNKIKSKYNNGLYAHVPNNWFTHTQPDGQQIMHPNKCIELGKGLVWTSNNSSSENAELAAKFKKQWQVTVSADVCVAA